MIAIFCAQREQYKKCLKICSWEINCKTFLFTQNNGAQQLASEATVYIMLEDVNDEIPLFTEREQETVLEGEPIGTKVTQVNAIDKDGTFPNNQWVDFLLNFDNFSQFY